MAAGNRACGPVDIIVPPPGPRRAGRKGWLAAWALAILSVASSAAPADAAPTLSVTMDKATVVKYPANTETIIVGNPIVADVTMLKGSGLVVLTGRGFGETNVVFLDRAGTILSEADLKVEAAPSLVTVQRGGDRESYACHPRCQPVVSLGDSTTFMGQTIGAIKSRNDVAAGAAAPH